MVPVDLQSFSVDGTNMNIYDYKKLLYENFVVQNRKLDAVVLRTELTALKTELTFQHFCTACSAPCAESRAAVDELSSKLGLDFSQVATTRTSLAASVARRQFDSIVNDISKNQVKFKQKVDKDKDEQRLRLERLQQASPMELLQRTIEAVIA